MIGRKTWSWQLEYEPKDPNTLLKFLKEDCTSPHFMVTFDSIKRAASGVDTERAFLVSHSRPRRCKINLVVD